MRRHLKCVKHCYDLFNMIHKQAEITVRYPKCIVLKQVPNHFRRPLCQFICQFHITAPRYVRTRSYTLYLVLLYLFFLLSTDVDYR
jgi:hypothetical protein